MYNKKCIFSVFLDGIPLSLRCAEESFYNKEDGDIKNEKMIKKYFKTNNALTKVLERIKTGGDERKIDIERVYNLIGYYAGKYRLTQNYIYQH